MEKTIALGLPIPFLGTALGSGCAILMKRELRRSIQRALTGYAADEMVAASVWSLLIPAMEQAESLGRGAFLPTVAGFWPGVVFLLGLDHAIPHLHRNAEKAEDPRSCLARKTMMALDVALG